MSLPDSSKFGKYTILNSIKKNIYTETYRIADESGNTFFLKVFDINKLPAKQIDAASGMAKEILYAREINHRNLVAMIESGIYQNEEGQFQFYVTYFRTGTILSDYVYQREKLPLEEAIKIFRAVVEGLNYLHHHQPALCHNDLDPSNIIVSDVDGADPLIIDLGHIAERRSGSVWFDTNDIDLLYHADECLSGIFDEQADIYSACAVLYFMLTGKAPWESVVDNDLPFKERFFNLIRQRKRNSLGIKSLGLPPAVSYILAKGLEKSNERFRSLDEVLTLLNDPDLLKEAPKVETKATETGDKSDLSPSSHSDRPSNFEADDPNRIDIEIKRGNGDGFKDVAGMQQLKEFLSKRVIFVIKNKDLLDEYKLTPPNGMLLYGPPGCGKTFIAEKFAEETGFNFMLVKSSDLASSFVHGSQQKISKLFKLAEKHAPIVICFDEFDAVVPDRSGEGARYTAAEVNEFLTQLNNCSKRGIFVVATTNRPDKIDPAVLRTGRIDKSIYVPLPDHEARREMFRLYLERRLATDDIDYEQLAKETEGYIASDIAYIVNDSAMTAAYTRSKISNEILFETIRVTNPSVRPDSISFYNSLREKMESADRRNAAGRGRIGYI